MEKEVMRYWDFMTELGIATDDEMGLAIALCGKNLHTMERVLYIKTGYRNIDQYIENELDDPTDEDYGI